MSLLRFALHVRVCCVMLLLIADMVIVFIQHVVVIVTDCTIMYGVVIDICVVAARLSIL